MATKINIALLNANVIDCGWVGFDLYLLTFTPLILWISFWLITYLYSYSNNGTIEKDNFEKVMYTEGLVFSVLNILVYVLYSMKALNFIMPNDIMALINQKGDNEVCFCDADEGAKISIFGLIIIYVCSLVLFLYNILCKHF